MRVVVSEVCNVALAWKVKKLYWDAPDGNQASVIDTLRARSLLNVSPPPGWRESLQHLQDQTKRLQLLFLPSDLLSRAARRDWSIATIKPCHALATASETHSRAKPAAADGDPERK